MACLVKKYLHHLSIDVGVVIDKPKGQVEPEPSTYVVFAAFPLV